MATDKIVSWEVLKKEVRDWQQRGLRIVFTNGCFDILHVGHVRYLKDAKACGDKLIVAINSDASVKKIKGERRPIVPQAERAEVVAALEFVDKVVIFDELTPLDLITFLQPDILVKGADWPEEKIVGREIVLERGGKVKRIPLAEGVSTSKIIKRILARYKTKTE
ncbi:MAG: D-glycero-beta-D-manno-heptose 1-phosphate adenylyltransferase [Candidatus Desulfofervidaceae bacterium]|nr:D-glycero-beta-D-manno-heptose 1-phosphate adenylyltransferase [Candidatus Desulfofervidaceae bacterium]